VWCKGKRDIRKKIIKESKKRVSDEGTEELIPYENGALI
jgi:hypothetical protein